MSVKRQVFKVYDMTCNSCEGRVEREIKKLQGIQNALASYKAQQVIVEFDNEKCTADEIKKAIHKAGYSTENNNTVKLAGILIIAAAIIILGKNTAGFDMESKLSGASYFMLFLVGMLTSIHCVGMCGGIMLSQSIVKESSNKFQAIAPALKYNLGRIVSYTIIGGIVGALGSVLSMSLMVKALLQIAAGLFMVIMGLNMAGFPFFRFINIKLPKTFCASKNRNKAPFIVGLLNGLMPCGPLQTMQLYALGTGSAYKGALSMFLFSLGTVPLMLTFGALSGLLSKGYTKTLLKYSGVLVLILGIIMGGRGLALAGVRMPSFNLMAKNSPSNADVSNAIKPEIVDGVQVIRMTADRKGYTPNVLVVQKNMPVKWIIDGKALNSCNNAIVAPSIDKEVKLKSGENVIEFTAGDKDINFSCWMGMITGVIKVTDNIDSVDKSIIEDVPAPSSGGSCCATDSEGGEETAAPSIYGDDFSKVPSDKIIKRATLSGKTQKVSVKGIGSEFEPMVVLATKGTKTSIIVDLNEFDYYEGTFTVVEAETQKEITSFEGKKGIVNLDLDTMDIKTYFVVKDYAYCFAIDVVEDASKSDLDEVRRKFFNN